MIINNSNDFLIKLVAVAVLLVSTVAGIQVSSAAETAKIAIVYPDVRAPFIEVFNEIIEGVRSVTPSNTETIVLTQGMGVEALTQQLADKNIGPLIVLGSRGLGMSAEINGSRKIVSGAAVSTPADCPEHVSCLSMLVSPQKMFQQLLSMVPKIKTIHVVYGEGRDEWLIQLAAVAAKQAGLKFQAVAVSSVMASAQYYQRILPELGKDDALWLLQRDASLKDSNLLAKILERAWLQDYVVFSNNPSHVKKGALFAMYPDNKALGATLGNLVLNLERGQSNAVTALENLQVAVNIRTAEHLQLDISRAQREQFDLVFPSR